MDENNKNKPREEQQLDLFNDFETARVFTCVAGAYIGKFNKDDPQNPIEVLSEYMNSEKEAQAALKRGSWNPPEPE